MSVQPIGSLTTAAPSLYATQASDSLGKTDFLRLLITQLQQQDPLNPQDPAEFTAQLSQFSALEQMIQMNQSIQDLQMLQLSTNNTLASTLIGKDVVYQGNGLTIASGSFPSIRFQADSAAQNVTVTVTNSQNQVVRTIQVPSATAGENTVTWDGKDNSGATLPDGTYHVAVSAQDAAGNPITMTPLQTGRVTGIIFRNGLTYLDINGAQIALGDIVSVHEPAGNAITVNLPVAPGWPGLG